VIRKVLRENPHARVVITGCYATRAPEILKEISDRLEVYSNQEKNQLPSCFGFELAASPLGIRRFSDHSRAFLKIQDGCQAPCRYCIIPKVRPKLWSKPSADVVKEAESLISNGYQELVLTGIRLGLYKTDVNLVGLLQKMAAIPGAFRIRLSSLEVTEISDKLIQLISENARICRHFHIPLQAGHTDVLKAMGRWYDLDYFKRRLDAVQKVLPDCGLTSDVMVGYPTETDEHFRIGLKNIENMGFSGLHVFRFSTREGTFAAGLTRLSPRVVSRRAGILGEVDSRLREQFYRKHEGTVRGTLCEPSGEGWTDNYIRVDIPKNLVKPGLLHTRVKSSQFERPPNLGAKKCINAVENLPQKV